MIKVVVATRNRGKLAEYRVFMPASVTLLSIDQLPVSIPEVEETGTTFHENALLKAKIVSGAAGLPAIADDSGLEVDALDGAPGLYSARYAGEHATDEANNAKLLAALASLGVSRPTARFRAVVAYADAEAGFEATADGVLEGHILSEPRGNQGFGYDPLFWATDAKKCLAELDSEARRPFSHRARALEALLPQLLGKWGLAKG